MTAVALEAPWTDAQDQAPEVEIAVPVFNEAADLEVSCRRLVSYLRDRFPLRAVVTIADNASTDGSWEIARRLAVELPSVRAVHLNEKGRGRALRAVWAASQAEVVAYMDVDLSTDLDALLPLVAPLLSGHSDVAIGSRLSNGARVVRGPKRELISRAYNLVLRAALSSRFSDAQCGFKAVRTDVARRLLPLIEDETWFFDTELLVLAERSGLRIHEVPVDWVDDPDSRVDIVRTAIDDLRGIIRLLQRFARGDVPITTVPAGLAAQVVRFAGVGVLSTIAYVAILLVLRPWTGVIIANLLALSATSVANLVAHRRFTFAAGHRARGRDRRRAALLLAIGAALTTTSLLIGEQLGSGSLPTDLVALALASAVATIVRFVALRAWSVQDHAESSFQR